MVHADILKTHHTVSIVRAGSSVDMMMKAMPGMYLWAAKTVENMIPAWVAVKTEALTVYQGTRSKLDEMVGGRSELRYIGFTESYYIIFYTHLRV